MRSVRFVSLEFSLTAVVHALVVSVLAWVFCATPNQASAQGGFLDQFVDPEDNHVDVSTFLDNGGFVPVPIIITEPAVGGGAGLAAVFLKLPEAGSNNDPTRTIFGFAGTGNNSKIGFGARFGSAFDGDLKYRAVVGGGSINLDFFPLGIPQGLSFNNEAIFANAEARYRLGESEFFLGPTLTAIQTTVSPNLGGGTPLPPALSRDIKMNALGLSLHFDNRDNPFTPRNGLNASAKVRRFDQAIGSDVDYTATDLFAAYFHSPNDKWTLSGMVLGSGTNGDTPFFMEPSINIRGVPFNRYQGDRVISTEFEVRRQLSPRWAMVGFAGYGKATSDGAPDISADSEAATFGAGIRYKLARKYGLDVGIDIARGPEDTVVYLQFGHAWAMNMD
ncbi:BamA/TamA family outer membrane protein [Primorskyibacter sp. S87]|uniref:BamA/TamA family outer membrane protein n=1 Tax=Primorskyibacter sp. S87 TaxID=3415126 RepID=UPI003C7D6F16